MKQKNIIKYIGGFILLFLFTFLCDRGLYYLLFNLETGLYSKNDFEQRFAKYMEGKSFSTLIFGTSRTYEGIHPVYIEDKLGEKCFKEAFQGKGPEYNYHFYQLYKQYAGVPKVVIYGVDYFIYTVASEHQWMSRFTKTLHRHPDPFFAAPLLLLKNKQNLDKFYTSVMNRLNDSVAAKKDDNQFKDIIDVQQYTGEAKSKLRMKTKAYKNFERQPYPRYPGAEGSWFVKLLDLLDKDGVTVILVSLPDYIGSYKTNYQRDKFIQNLKGLMRKRKKVHVLNYNRPRRFELNKLNYFNDGGYGETNSHLSELGARIFTNKLAEEIRKYYKENGHHRTEFK